MTPSHTSSKTAHSHKWHHHDHVITDVSRAFFISIGINILFVIVEIIYGLRVNSLSLLSDAGHNFMDVINLILSWLAIWIASKSSSSLYTYGYKRGTMLATLLNTLLLIVSAGFLIYEWIYRLYHPTPTEWVTMMIVASIGIMVNGFSGWILMKQGKEDINIKAAYIHLIGDALVSLGVVIGWAVIYYTGYSMIDPILSIIISLIMSASIVSILRESIRMNFDGVPSSIDTAQIEENMKKIPWIASYHHLHVWALSTTENALTLHIVLSGWADEVRVKSEIRHMLEHDNIHHVTIETELRPCSNQNCTRSIASPFWGFERK